MEQADQSSRNQPWAPKETVATNNNPSTHTPPPHDPAARLHHPQTHARTHTHAHAASCGTTDKKNLSMKSAQKCGADQISVFFFLRGWGGRREATPSRISKRHRRNRQVSRIHPEIRLNCAIGALLWPEEEKARGKSGESKHTRAQTRLQTPSCATPAP